MGQVTRLMEYTELNEKLGKLIENQSEILKRLKMIEDRVYELPKYV